MIALVFLFVVVWNFYIGYSRGFVLQAYYSLSAIISFIGASFYYKRLADALTLWVPYSNPTEDSKMSFFQSVNIFELDKVFYAGVAFLLIYVALYLILRFIGLFMHFVDIQRFDEQRYHLIAGGLSSLLTVIFISMVLTVFATIPMPLVQNFLGENVFLRLLIHLPGLSQLLHLLWVTAIL